MQFLKYVLIDVAAINVAEFVFTFYKLMEDCIIYLQ